MTAPRAPYGPEEAGRRGPFVVLEGVSGVGKSTLARLLAVRLGGSSVHTLTDPHTGCSEVINKQLRPLPQFAFYLSGLLHVSDVVRRALSEGPVVADRYASSVVACHAAVNRVPLGQVQELITPFRGYLAAPDATFYLTVSDNSLKARMGTKSDVKQHDSDLFDVPGRLDRLRDNFRAVAGEDPSAVVLPTDDRSPEELADLIVKHLEGDRA
ncbi:dTMP kinase [Streptomyces sp. CMB-StM0423]|uniref:dTMP kinase n=1 Tax=Streptomyces sp. CMB-StM0423 TaxID=2059884 RepID=UPI000C70B8E8|nr:thymidylate kinase [Streptomyces sp. CMB-StM0423]AUH40482.1 thymidylate kinase [Streptomyces sp. CMB-StM0423]